MVTGLFGFGAQKCHRMLIIITFCLAKIIQNPTFQTGLEIFTQNPTFQTGGVVLQDTESLENLTRKIKQNVTNMTEDHD
jgi:hypothetical protein